MAANIEFTFTPFNIVFGLLDEDTRRTQLINTTILLDKIHIFKSQRSNLRRLKSRFKIPFILEKIIATKNQRLNPP